MSDKPKHTPGPWMFEPIGYAPLDAINKASAALAKARGEKENGK